MIHLQALASLLEASLRSTPEQVAIVTECFVRCGPGGVQTRLRSPTRLIVAARMRKDPLTARTNRHG